MQINKKYRRRNDLKLWNKGRANKSNTPRTHGGDEYMNKIYNESTTASQSGIFADYPRGLSRGAVGASRYLLYYFSHIYLLYLDIHSFIYYSFAQRKKGVMKSNHHTWNSLHLSSWKCNYWCSRERERERQRRKGRERDAKAETRTAAGGERGKEW